ncbi:MAG: SpoIIE family protein phosphatase, partial [Leptospiraceae bacterium]|nr:SpoIIE family protein phosphatase [Leptospiraceae bacterium]
SGTYFFFICFAALPFVFFESRQKYYILFVIISGLLNYIVFESLFKIYQDNSIFTEENSIILSYTCFISTYLVVLLVVWSLEKSNLIAEKAITDLKEHQDGDYFLTTRIVEPLFKNLNFSKICKTEFFSKQKKIFPFKGKTFELGGDINISGNLTLRGQKYTMLVNADAMGKSLQGAGGSIVFGTIMNSILSRNNNISLNIHPRDWLFKTYNELQNVFVEFDGAMFISCFLGLVHDDSGKFYYFNSEHPYGILFRDGKAQFLDQVPFKKIGFPGFLLGDEGLRIHEFQLETGDSVFIGSDGRDDIDLKSFGDERKINEDENLILSFIESSDGDLNKLYEEICKHGTLIDDLSFIKLTYLGSEKFDQKKLDIENIKSLIKNYYYKKALEELELFEDELITPELIYLRVLCMEKVGLGTAALSIIEKKLFELKEYIPAIHLYSYIHYRAGEYEKSKKILDNYLDFNPDSKKTKEILSKVENKISLRNM